MFSFSSSQEFRSIISKVFLLGLILSLPESLEAQIFKANNTNALNLTTSWTVGTVPGPTDVAVWDSTVTGANTSFYRR